MEGSFSIFFLGWGLLGQWWMSRGELSPKPSISVHPSGVVALGGNVSIHCQTESQPHAEYYLLKEADSPPITSAVKVAEPYEVIFPIINASKSDGGKYWCIYHFTSDPQNWSPPSDTVYINLTDPTLPKPSINIRRRKTAPGQNVTIECQAAGNGLTFALHKASMQPAFQTSKPERDGVEFHFFMVRSEDAGNYTCQYHHSGNPFVWSEPSETVELILKADSPLILTPTAAWVRLGVAGVVMLSLVLIVSEAACSWRREKLYSNSD